jgi:3-methyladenine DNA glycosylase AlkD
MKTKNAYSIDEVVKILKQNYNPKNVAGMARFGISVDNAFGVSMPFLRKLGKQIGKDHQLALQLWKSGYHEARVLASIVADPKQLTAATMDQWIKDFDSWDVCDQTCMNLFDKHPDAFKKALSWAKRTKEFEKRAGFSLMAVLAWHRRELPNSNFKIFFPLIKIGAFDERNFVKKAVNWAIRQFGKRNREACDLGLKLSKEILKLAAKAEKAGKLPIERIKAARWVANGAINELNNPKTIKRLS